MDYFRQARRAAPPRYVNGSGAQWPCIIAEGTPAERVSVMALVHWVGSSDDLLLDDRRAQQSGDGGGQNVGAFHYYRELCALADWRTARDLAATSLKYERGGAGKQ